MQHSGQHHSSGSRFAARLPVASPKGEYPDNRMNRITPTLPHINSRAVFLQTVTHAQDLAAAAAAAGQEWAGHTRLGRQVATAGPLLHCSRGNQCQQAQPPHTNTGQHHRQVPRNAPCNNKGVLHYVPSMFLSA